MGKVGSGGTQYTRRSHIVRCYADPKDAENNPNSGTFIDVEVLDAIAFRIENNKEVIINCSKAVVPTIKDDTGDNNGVEGGSDTTRLSHMKRITSTDGSAFFDAEILDAAAFRDQNGDEWVLNMKDSADNPNVYNKTTGEGSSYSATRRVHDEKVAPASGSSDGSSSSDTPPSSFILSRRTDAISFRRQNGFEVVLSMPSNDDPQSDDPSAPSYITPQGYDPTDTSDNAVVPPPNNDPNIYIAFADDNSGDGSKNTSVLTSSKDDDNGGPAVDMGPLWWIRNVSSGGTWFGFTMVLADFTRASGYITFDDIPALVGAQLDLMDTNFMPSGAQWTDLDQAGGQLTRDQLSQTILTSGDTSVKGFGLYEFSDLVNPTSAAYISASSGLFNKPFNITFHVDTPYSPESQGFGAVKFSVFALTKKDGALVKAGADAGDLLSIGGFGPNFTPTLFSDPDDISALESSTNGNLESTSGTTPTTTAKFKIDLSNPAKPQVTRTDKP